VLGHGSLGGTSEWITFLAGTGSILLTFLAGAELDPRVFRRKWREATVIGLIGFFAPFFGATAVARFLLGWDARASWLAGVALSTTSVAVVYAVMLELGFNRTDFGKAILVACFINDLGTVVGLFPAVRRYDYVGREGWYYTLMMSTGLTFGTISALFGLNHGIISPAQYSYLVATVIGSAVVPTMIANAFFMPAHLLTEVLLSEVAEEIADGAA